MCQGVMGALEMQETRSEGKGVWLDGTAGPGSEGGRS